MKREWVVRIYKNGDEKGIYELWKTVYPEEKRTLEAWTKWWRWTYRDGPNGQGQIWVADHAGKIVGQYGVIFTKMKLGDKVVLGSQNIDVMTHPEYRNQGIFGTLEKQALDEIGNQSVHLTIGFPNAAAYVGHIKSGWFDIANMQTMVKTFNWKNLIEVKITNKLLSALMAVGSSLVFGSMSLINIKRYKSSALPAVNRISSFDERFDRLWARVSDQYPNVTVRNKEYLNWRYTVPDKDYVIFAVKENNEVNGYLVLGHRNRMKAKASFIFDMIAESEKVKHCLLTEAIKESRRAGSDFIEYRFIADKTHQSVLRKTGFVSVPFIKGSYYIAYSSFSQPDVTMLKNPDNWFVQVGDSDTL